MPFLIANSEKSVNNYKLTLYQNESKTILIHFPLIIETSNFLSTNYQSHLKVTYDENNSKVLSKIE